VLNTAPSGQDTDPSAVSPTPTWVYAEGARSFTVVEYGVTQHIPVLLDPTFLKEYQTFIQQLAARVLPKTPGPTITNSRAGSPS